MQPVVDAMGNLKARWRALPEVEQPVFVLGSHLDTVRNAGAYDGPLGVVAALACVEQLQAWGLTLPFDVEIVAFADEEGLRFQTAYLGSAYYVGALEESGQADRGVRQSHRGESSTAPCERSALGRHPAGDEVEEQRPANPT